MSCFVRQRAVHTQYPIISAPVYDQIIIGGGISGLMSAYQILSLATEANRPIKLAVFTKEINAPAQAGSNLDLGFDGYDVNRFKTIRHSLYMSEKDKLVLSMLHTALSDLQDIVQKENIACRFNLGGQILYGSYLRAKIAKPKMIRTMGYESKDFYSVSDKSRIKFTDYDDSNVIGVKAMGQINVPEFLGGLCHAIQRMGGQVITGVTYQSHQKSKPGHGINILTNKGLYFTERSPLIALGPTIQDKIALPDSISMHAIYSGAIHIQLSPKEAAQISAHPVAFCESKPGHNFFWGSIDSAHVLTFGSGADDDPGYKEKNCEEIIEKLIELLPWVKTYIEQGKFSFSFGAQSSTGNDFPIVGRLNEITDVMGGWGGRGILASLPAAKAYAKWVVHSNDANLKLFERYNLPNPHQHKYTSHIPQLAT